MTSLTESATKVLTESEKVPPHKYDGKRFKFGNAKWVGTISLEADGAPKVTRSGNIQYDYWVTWKGAWKKSGDRPTEYPDSRHPITITTLRDGKEISVRSWLGKSANFEAYAKKAGPTWISIDQLKPGSVSALDMKPTRTRYWDK